MAGARRSDAVGARPVLRVVGGGVDDPAPLGGDVRHRPRSRRDYTEADYGHPSCQFKLAGSPVELRIWPAPPPPGVSAVLHPSGVWVAMRVVD
jgi:hypothetical protein